ncbi:hypothetical protein BDY17DRAFT_297104 [Neohortaea acidophila]|uniref:Archaemetzincin-2 n=1 Tax=Neohortaea acidophila TaxID=245834 RepID=A0A6A6PTD6_9PEZI|nr:uncharacterized protein BDY17DRAFT_297104 [Neohortaea acidophila]KAF2483252.1 hypothetical protein BDY17DRAFT_297104 [Neohortaea acidophila]
MHLGLVFNSNYGSLNTGGYKQPSRQEIHEALETSDSGGKKRKRAKTATTQSSAPKIDVPSSSTFPAPLVLPGDELAEDPEYPRQSVQDWLDDAPNKVTKQRRTIYLVSPPGAVEDAAVVAEWTQPTQKGKKSIDGAQPPRVEGLAEYLRAFYHGMTVKLLDLPGLEFTAWESDDEPEPRSRSRKTQSTAPEIPPYIGLSTGTELVRIRCRQTKTFPAQLNLNDLLDVALEILPTDAYAICMLVHHDLYEDEQDDFCCGRAYGGSRVAVVSSARYRPDLDLTKNVHALPVCDERANAWPASHWIPYLTRVLHGPNHKALYIPPDMRDCAGFLEYHPGSAIAAGITAFRALPLPTSPRQLTALWFGRVCKTVSHEIGHCFGMDHCVYFACIMQGTASVAEDVRQPPYLCPIDLSKVLRAISATDVNARYEALLAFCERWKDDRMFAAFAAWLRVRLEQRHALPA